MRQTGSREIDSSRQESRQPSWRWTIARAVQQRPELGDLVAGGVHVGLAQDRAGRVVHDRQQMHGAAPRRPLPRGVLPSTAIARRHARVGGGGCVAGWSGCWSASHRPITRSNASGSTRASTRRTVASAGGRQIRRSGSRRLPSAASTGPGASAAHSPIAVRDLAPASTAATATASTVPSACRRPRRWRGSVIWPRSSSRLRHWSGASTTGMSSRLAAAGIGG